MIGNIFALEAPNLTGNGRDHYYLSPEDEKKAVDRDLEEARCISRKLGEIEEAIHKREWPFATIWKGVSDEKTAAMKASQDGRHMVFVAEIRADMVERKLLVARECTTEEKKNEVLEDNLSVRMPNSMDKVLIRYWACKNSSKMALMWRKLNPVVRESTIHASLPRLLHLHIIGFPSEEKVYECSTRFRVFNATTNRGAVYNMGVRTIVPCSSDHDTILLQAFSKDGSLDQPLCSAYIPLTASALSGDIITLPMAKGELLGELAAGNSTYKTKNATGTDVDHHQPVIIENCSTRGRVYIRVEASWVYDIKRKVEFGEFYYRVVKEDGCQLYKDAMCSEIALSKKFTQGEILKSTERQRCPSDGCVYVKCSELGEARPQTGWLCEIEATTEGHQRCLEHLNPPTQQHGQYFYCVVHPAGMKLLSRPDENASYLPHVIPMGSVIEASNKFTPMGASTTFVYCHAPQGYFVERHLDGAATVISSSDNEIQCEAIPCPDAVEKSYVEVREVYSVIAPEGIYERSSPFLTAIKGGLLTKGTAFTSTCYKEVSYEGIGSVIFVQKASDNKWVRMEAAGTGLLKLVTDSVELGPYTYIVIHEHGVVVQSAPGFNTLPKRPHKILPMGKVIQVEEKRIRAEDIVASDSPTVFLKLANDEGWVYEMRQYTRICQEVKKNSSVTNA